MEVKGVERWGADWRNVVIGELLEVDEAPARRPPLAHEGPRPATRSSRSSAARRTSPPGQRVPVALPGAVLPGDRAIERTEKMGVVSNGMLCSGDELRLTGDADGILILPADTPLGVPLADLYGDVVLDVDVKPNRGDALSPRRARPRGRGDHRGAGALPGDPARRRRRRRDRASASRSTSTTRRSARGSSAAGSPASRVGPSPDRVQMRLLAAGMRPVSNVVDATNYVMLELGKPTHAFDAAAVARDDGGSGGDPGRASRRPASASRRSTTSSASSTPETLLIADARGPLAIAGVMGGAASEVSDATTDVVVESAIFDPVSIRRTAFHFALRSEASLRFEKGQEARLARIGADRVAELIVAWAGGAAAAGRVDTAPAEPPPARGSRSGRAGSTGCSARRFTDAEQAALLERVGIGVRAGRSRAPRSSSRAARSRSSVAGRRAGPRRDRPDLAARPPHRGGRRRGDRPRRRVRHRPHEDARHADAALPARPARGRATRSGGRSSAPGSPRSSRPRSSPRRRPPGSAGRSTAADGVPGQDAVAGRPIRVRNPLSERHAVLRSGLVGEPPRRPRANERHGRDDVAIFEVGKGYAADPAGAPAEWWRLGFLLAGGGRADAVEPRRPRPWDLEDAKALVALVARVLGVAEPDLPAARRRRAAPSRPRGARRGPGLAGRRRRRGPPRDPGRVGPPGRAGHRRRSSRSPAWPAASWRRSRAPPLERHAAVERDLALVVAEDRAGRGRGGDAAGGRWPALLRSLELFDVYRGAPLGPGEKSLAWRLRLQGDDGALDEDAAGGGRRAARRRRRPRARGSPADLIERLRCADAPRRELR